MQGRITILSTHCVFGLVLSARVIVIHKNIRKALAFIEAYRKFTK